jgi:hypothetical protein
LRLISLPYTPHATTTQVDVLLKILCADDPATGRPVLGARDLGALALAVAALWRPHPAMRGGLSIVDEAARCTLQAALAALGPTASEEAAEEEDRQHEIRGAVLLSDESLEPPATPADAEEWLCALRRVESRFTAAHPAIEISGAGTRVTMHADADQLWRTAVLGHHVMRRGQHYAEFNLVLSSRQGSMTFGVVDSGFRPANSLSATQTKTGWGYWAHSVRHRPSLSRAVVAPHLTAACARSRLAVYLCRERCGATHRCTSGTERARRAAGT